MGLQLVGVSFLLFGFGSNATLASAQSWLISRTSPFHDALTCVVMKGVSSAEHARQMTEGAAVGGAALRTGRCSS